MDITLSYLRFNIDSKIFSFISNSLNRTGFQQNWFCNFWNFLQFSIEFTSQQHNSHEITKTLTQRSPNSTVPMSLELAENPLNLFQLLHEVL
jgi:hypothetical protein